MVACRPRPGWGGSRRYPGSVAVQRKLDPLFADMAVKEATDLAFAQPFGGGDDGFADAACGRGAEAENLGFGTAVAPLRALLDSPTKTTKRSKP